MDEPAAQPEISQSEPDNTLKTEHEDLVNFADTGLRSPSVQDAEIIRLAREITAASARSHVEAANNPFNPELDSELDPRSANFKPRAWVKALLYLKSRDPERFPDRTSGLSFRNLNVYGYGNLTDYQKSVGNVWLGLGALFRKITRTEHRQKIEILHEFDGLVESGEMLVVLGPPGSGCSTLLKTIAGEIHGIYIGEGSELNYQGVSSEHMRTQFRGEAIYTAEVDVHFPMLSVGDTLAFAAMARAPRDIPGAVSRWTYATQMRDVVMAMFGITHTINTCVGDDYIRGVSGGERKRVSIAEASLSGAPLQCWDNSTRGLDSANAIDFCKTLRQSADLMGVAACVAVYQAPGAAYKVFDKVTILYEGHQIFFGPIDKAKGYFEKLGFQCPARQTDPDFLTSMTSAEERIVRPGWEDRVPKTPSEFAAIWRTSNERAYLIEEIAEYNRTYPIGGEHLKRFRESKKASQSKRQRTNSPYTLDYMQQIKLCLWRGFKRLRGDPSLTITQLVSNLILSIVVGSIFFNLEDNASSFFSRGSLLFFAVLINAIASALEILILYAQRGIVEKHSRYALYHPSAEAFASMLVDIPYKFLNAFTFNIPLYFMTNLKREPGSFFFFILTTFLLTLAMSMVFRTIAATSRTLAQALAPGSIVILSLLMYSGFAIPKPYILGWSKWIYYLDPLSYAFESLMVNEFSGHVYPCSQYVPAGTSYIASTGQELVCAAVGAKPGLTFVNGDDYIISAFEYKPENKWRNIGIIIVFIIGFCATHVFATEYINEKKSKGEILLFPRGAKVSLVQSKNSTDVESPPGRPIFDQKDELKQDEEVSKVNDQAAIFHWEDLCYDIKIKSEPRRILDHVDGWVKPGTLTALMGVSGAGKTTLLDVLASRVRTGVITGDMFVDGQQRDQTFQRSTGYVQQQDLHLLTSTVREALTFSALLRQPGHISREEKHRYVDEVIDLLDMELYADAIIGVPGEGLNVEQRKRLTIGVELAAKPQLLLFLDEPTSGLDSQTSWIICNLMEKLKNRGQAILCTIHQPSAILFERFDRLLFLAKGGKTVYFGEIGRDSKILTNYFEKNGAPPCPPLANPAEWMLEIIGAAPGSSTTIDWTQTWKWSNEYIETKMELANLLATRPQIAAGREMGSQKGLSDEFAAPFSIQFWEVSKRVFEQYWRTPSYIYSKATLTIGSALFIGFSFFDADNSRQGLQNQTFSLFMLFSIFGQLAQQIMPNFITQRSLYEVREQPSKTYSWKVFVLSNIIVEIPWNILIAVFMYLAWYYPMGSEQNAVPTDAVAERGGLMFFYVLTYLIFTSTFSTMIVAGMDQAAEGANIANLLFILSLMFCGVLATKDSLPGFWIFMYRVSPFTYLVGGMLSTAVANTDVVCAANEYLLMQPTSGVTCGEYLRDYIALANGYVVNGNATDDCLYCPTSTTNDYLATISIYWSEAWRNLGLIWVYIIFNIAGALAIYWLVRMPKKITAEKAKKA